MDKTEKITQRVRLLLARADHPNTPIPEAELARERAEKLMAQYRIEQDSLTDEERAAQGVRPVRREWWVAPAQGEFINEYANLAQIIQRHVDARAHWSWKNNPDDDNNLWVYGEMFGFEADLDYGSMLLNACVAEFGEALEPKPDPSKTDGENVFRMRQGGMERNRIAAVLWGSAMDDGSAHGKVTRLFKKECERRGEDASAMTGKRVNAKTYRSSYASGFVLKMWYRLDDLRQSTGQTGMVLHNRTKAIDELYWESYPHMRPAPADDTQRTMSTFKGSSECAKCAKAKNGRCREHHIYKTREAPVNAAGARRGQEAARNVNLGYGQNRTLA